ncbi:MAG: thioredoxin [Maricaulaceae bacterium]
MKIFGAGASPEPPTAPQTSGDIVEGSDAAFMADVIEASRERPVIVDFWAPWCGPCRQLVPALERAVTKAKGKVKLVKINVDENPGVAGQLRVQSIPAVYVFQEGRPVDGFMGALPESQIQAFVDRFAGAGPDAQAIEAMIAEAQSALEAGDAGGAAQDFAQVLQIESQNADAIAGLARCYLVNGEPDKAREILGMAEDETAKAAAIQSVKTALELAADAPASALSITDYRRRLEGAPDDHATRFDFAACLAAQGYLGEAFVLLLDIIARDREGNEDPARKQLLKIFEAAGPTSPITKSGRSKLSALLFS